MPVVAKPNVQGVGAASLPWVKRLQPVGSGRTRLPPLAESNQVCVLLDDLGRGGCGQLEQPTRPSQCGCIRPGAANSSGRNHQEQLTRCGQSGCRSQCLGSEKDRLVLDEAVEAAATSRGQSIRLGKEWLQPAGSS